MLTICHIGTARFFETTGMEKPQGYETDDN